MRPAALLLALALGAAPGAAAACKVPAQLGELRANVVDRANARRGKSGLKDLARSKALARAAQDHACWIARTGRFSHTGANGSDIGARATGAGYRWSFIAENIAEGQSGPRAVMTSWMGSRGHRRNILAARAREIGIGVALNGGNRPVWVMVLGAPR